MIRGIVRESNSLNSAKAGGASTTTHVYQLPQAINASLTTEGNGLSVSGINEKLLYKGGSANMRGVADNSGNGYLIKSAQNTVKQMHSS